MSAHPTGKYRVILADPPWQYRVFNDAPAAYGAARSAYPTMSAESLKALPVSALADKNCALFMWATMPCLPQAFDLMHAWGFEYKTVAFTWVKRTKHGGAVKGIGHYTQSNAEVCLLGIRGKVQRRARNVPQIIEAVRRGHSRKPDEQYERIMRLFDGPYLEMFARQRWPGWDVWGNQTDLFPVQVPLLSAAV